MASATWVVGVDGSDDSRTALAWAVAQATGRDAQIVAMCTWLAPILPSDTIGQPALLMDWDRFEAELRRHLDKIIASVRTPGVAVGPEITARVEQGRAARAEFKAEMNELDPARRARRSLKLQDARQALCEAADDADLVVLGARGHGWLGAALLGSVSTWMLHAPSHATVIVPGHHQ